jgi:CBS domain-containing protein
MARGIVEAAGEGWGASFESRGGTVTTEGLIAVWGSSSLLPWALKPGNSCCISPQVCQGRARSCVVYGCGMDDGTRAFLADALSRSRGKEVSLSIRDFIAMWGAKRRGFLQVHAIQSDLAELGLETVPAFEDGWIDNVIALVPLRTATDVKTIAEGTPAVVSEDQATSSTSAVVSLRVSGLASASRGVESVSRDDTLTRAQSLMLQGDYSQLPVLAGQRVLEGAVSWESIAQARIKRPEIVLRDCIVPADVVNLNDDLVTHIPRITENGYVFVRDTSKKIGGVITTADLSGLFLSVTGPFLLIGEVERRLRRIAGDVFDLEQLKEVRDPGDANREVTGVDDLTVGEYVRLFEAKDRWEQLGWDVDRKVFVESLTAFRELRNEIMHFSPDPIEQELLSKVRNLAHWLKLLQA